MGLENFVISLILVSAISAVLILILMALRPFFKSRYTIGLKQFLWIMLAIRLIIPFSYENTFFTVESTEYDTGAKVYISKKITDEEKTVPESVYATLPEGLSRESAIDWGTPFAGVYDNRGMVFSNEVVGVTADKESSEPKPVAEENWKDKIQYYMIQGISTLNAHMDLAASVYIGGVVLFLLYHGGAMVYFRSRRKKVRSKVSHDSYLRIMSETAKRIGVKRLPALYEIEGLASPMATGFFRFEIYIPQQDYSEKEFRAVITHELTHIYHQDLRIKMLYLLANAMHWFNPAVYLMLREAGRDMELYCDKSIVKMFQWEERQEYNELLLSILKSHSNGNHQEYMTTCFKGGVKEMKERFLLNLDMGKKREGIVPILLAGAVIAVSAGLFSVEVKAKSQAQEDEFWAKLTGLESSDDNLLEDGIITNMPWSSSFPFSEDEEYTYEDSDVIDLIQEFPMGDPSCEEVAIGKDGDNYLVPRLWTGSDGIVCAVQMQLAPERKEWEEAPDIEIYAGTTQIADYGTEVYSWQEGDTPKLEEKPEFFAHQCREGEANPVFEVLSWNEYSDNIRIFFPNGQMPDSADVSDVVLNEDGSIRYEGREAEVIYRNCSFDVEMDMLTIPLAQHYSITAYENLYDKELMSQPFYRGYKVRCFWGGESKLQSCVYYFVLRTRSTVYDNMGAVEDSETGPAGIDGNIIRGFSTIEMTGTETYEKYDDDIFVKEMGYIKTFTMEEETTLTIDYVEPIVDSQQPGGVRYVNSTQEQDTYTVKADAEYRIMDSEDAYEGEWDNRRKRVTKEVFAKYLKDHSGTDVVFQIIEDDGVVYSIEEQYAP